MLRLGSIQYINSLPVDFALSQGIVKAPIKIVHGTPAELNRMLQEGELDASAISSIAYAQASSELLLIPGLSINSDSGIKSVILLSQFPIEALGGKTITLTPEAATTPALLSILLQKFYQVEDVVTIPLHSTTRADAYLYIGDQALYKWHNERGDFPYHYDLAELWRKCTGEKFVFAVWAVRRSVWEAHPTLVAGLALALHQSQEWGKLYRSEIIKVASERLLLPRKFLADYFSKLRYDFDPACQEGLALFYRLAEEVGILSHPVSLQTIEELVLQ